MITRKNDMPVDVKVNMRGGAGEAVLTALSPALPPKTRLFSTITLKPGCGIGYHVHEGETEMFYFASGSGRVCDDGEWYDIAAGDSMTTPGGHGHAVENTGDADLILVAVIVLD